MKKIIQFFNSSLFLPVAIDFVLYIFWLLTVAMNESLLTGSILLAIYFAGMIFVRLSEKHWGYSLLAFLILPSISIYVAGVKFWGKVLPTAITGIHNHITGLMIIIALLIIYSVIVFQSKVRMNGKAVMPLFLFIVTLPFFVLNFGYYLSTEVDQKEKFGQYTYLILDTEDSDFHPYLAFYKCAKWGFDCQHLYNSYSATIGWKIIIDEQKKEVSLFDEIYKSFLYTDGENPRNYARGTGGILKDYLYSLSEKCDNPTKYESYVDCESYTYIPYKCNINGVLCNPIPIRYTTNSSDYYYWIENDLQNEISLYNSNSTNTDDILIFTYGMYSRCHVDGCKIIEQDTIEP
jgi:hypothetical protein